MKLASKLASIIFAASAVFSTNALAAQFNCGVFLDDEEKPAATAGFDTASGTRATMQAGDFVGFVQVNENSGAKSGANSDEPLLLIGAVAKDKTVSIAAYPMNSDMMLSLLKASSGKQAITTCVAAGAEIIRPAGI